MKKKFLALAMAAAVVFSTSAVSAHAAISAEDGLEGVRLDGGNLFLDCGSFMDDVSTVYGVEFTFEAASPEEGFGGGIIINAENNNWDQAEWGNEGADKQWTAVADGDVYKVSRVSDAPVFVVGESYSNFALSQWWGGDLKIVGYTLLGADGKALGAAEEAPVEEEPVAEDTTVEAPAEEVTTEAPAELPKTGLVSGAVFFAAGALVTAAGAMVAKKKED